MYTRKVHSRDYRGKVQETKSSDKTDLLPQNLATVIVIVSECYIIFTEYRGKVHSRDYRGKVRQAITSNKTDLLLLAMVSGAYSLWCKLGSSKKMISCI